MLLAFLVVGLPVCRAYSSNVLPADFSLLPTSRSKSIAQLSPNGRRNLLGRGRNLPVQPHSQFGSNITSGRPGAPRNQACVPTFSGALVRSPSSDLDQWPLQ